MKIALTGASGFIGRHVAAELERRGVDTIVAGRGTGSTIPFDLMSPDHCIWDDSRRPDVLIHMAWAGLPNYSAAHHIDQVPAHYRFLRSMLDSGVQHVLVAGTCYEYGLQSGPLAETAEARPCTAYGAGKDVLRRMLESLQLVRPDRPFLTWARLFYPWGEGQAGSALYSQLVSAALRGDAEFPMSAGEQLRDYLHVNEMASLLVDLALARGPSGLVNVCSGQPVSVRVLVERWIARQGWPIRPVLGRYPYPAHEPLAFWGDDDKLRKVLQR